MKQMENEMNVNVPLEVIKAKLLILDPMSSYIGENCSRLRCCRAIRAMEKAS